MMENVVLPQSREVLKKHGTSYFVRFMPTSPHLGIAVAAIL